MSDIPTRPTRPVFSPPKEPSIPPKEVEASTPDDLAEQKMITFVTAQIEKMKEYLHLGAGRDPTFFEVNQALCSYQDTQLALLAIHNSAKIEYTKAKEAFDDWFAQKYLLVRERINPRSVSAQKWYSQKEIEMMVRQEFPEEFKRLNWEMITAEHQLNFLRRLLDSWGSYAYTLNQLSKNLIAEVGGLNFPDSEGERV